MAYSLDSGSKEHFREITKADRDELYEAIEEGDEDTVKVVLDKVPGIVTTLSDDYFCFYLHLACMNDQAKICEQLLRCGADVNQADDQQDTPLYIAVNHEASIDLVQILLNHGANVSSQNRQRRSPFHAACITGSLEHIEELIKYAKGPLNETDLYGQNGLHLALQNWNSFDTNEDLLDSITLIVNSGVQLNAQDYKGWSVLHHASYYLGMDFIPRLLKMGVDPFLQDCNGDTFMTVLAERYLPTEFNKILIDLVTQLEIVKCDIVDSDETSTIKASEKFINLQNLSGKSIFHLFLRDMELPTLKRLLDKGADICLQDNVGQSPLHICAAMEDGLDKLNLLIEYGGNTNARDVHGRSPVFEVIECRATRLLIDNGSDPNIEDKLGMSPLHAVALDHRPDVIKTLLQNGALVNKQDIYGSTALHYASWWNYKTIIDLLKTSGTDSTIEDQNGNSAARVQATDQVANSFRIQDLISPGLSGPVSSLAEEGTDMTIAKKDGLSGTEFSKTLLSTPRLGLLSDIGEVRHVKRVVYELVNKLMCYVTKLDARFEGSLFPTGSSSEGTRVGEPDEFDFLYFLEIFGKECAIGEIYYYLIEGFVQLKSNDLTSSCANYFDGNGLLDGDLVRGRMRKLLEIAVNQKQMWDSNEMFFVDFTDDSLKPVLNIEVRYIGSFFKALEISIDIVPAVYKKPWWPSTISPDSFKLMTNTVRDAGCAVLLQTPKMKFETDDNNANYMRISSAPAEIALFKHLPAYVKKSYALIKVLLSGDVCPPVIGIGCDEMEQDFSAGYYISSYMIKNCLLHEVEQIEHIILTSLMSGEMCVSGNERTMSSEGKQSTADGKNAVNFEDLYEKNDSDIIDTISFAKKILLRFRDCVQKGNLPSYFMPSVNVLGYEYRAVYGEEHEKVSESIKQKQDNRKIITSKLLDFLEKC